MFHAAFANMATEATALSVRAMGFFSIAQQVEKPYHTHHFLVL
jgi:hypothetical protein